MNQPPIFVPFAGTLLLTLVVWVYMYARRLPFMARSGLIRRRQLSHDELARLSPPQVASPADNFRNLCELPPLFYAAVLYLHVTHQVDAAYLTAAWVFFVFRVLHSFVHCTVNHIPLRFLMYVIASLALWFTVIRITLAVLR